jgi:uncharacterized protein (TIGR02265 family)
MLNQPPTPPLRVVTRIARPFIPDDQKRILFPLRVILASFDAYLTPANRAQLEDEFAPYLDHPYYPVLVGNSLTDRVCELCLADHPVAEARQILGRAYVRRYQETLFGKMLAVAGPLLQFEWILKGLPNQYAAATNFGTYWVAEVAPHHWRFDFEDDPGYPDWILGTLQAGSEAIHMTGGQISYTVLAPRYLSFTITWP